MADLVARRMARLVRDRRIGAGRSNRSLVEPAGLHDHVKVGALVGEKPKVFERVAIDEQQIGRRSGLDDTECEACQ